MEVRTKSEEETQKIAQDLAKRLHPGDIVCLYGDLGAGKSVFVRGIAKELGIKKRILSPTFVIMRTYPGLYHLDLYRIDDIGALGLDEILDSNNIVVIEWAEKLKDSLPKKRIDVKIKKVDEQTRKVSITHTPVILNPNEVRVKDLNKAASVLKRGGVVVFPTDTVYGIGCQFDNPSAIDRIYKIKGTPKTQHFPVLVSNISQVEKIADINETAKKLMEKHWPGGLTIILNARCRSVSSSSVILGNEVTPESSLKIGFRMPALDTLRKIIDDVGPIVGTSANFHGKKAPTSFEELDSKLVSMVDYVVKGKCKKGIESTVVDTTVDPPKILRQGAVKL